MSREGWSDASFAVAILLALLIGAGIVIACWATLGSWTKCELCSGNFTGPNCKECKPHWQGANCDTCAPGWSGADCATEGQITK